MVKRIFDRRGRQNWDAHRLESENRRMRERRTKSDRRIHQRRQDNPWPNEVVGDEQRIAERRVIARRSGPEAAAVSRLNSSAPSATIETDHLGQQSGPSLLSGTLLLEAITRLSQKNVEWIAVLGGDQYPAGILSQRDVIQAIAQHGDLALSEPVSRFMTPLT